MFMACLKKLIKLIIITVGVALIAGMAFILGMAMARAVTDRGAPRYNSLPLVWVI